MASSDEEDLARVPCGSAEPLDTEEFVNPMGSALNLFPISFPDNTEECINNSEKFTVKLDMESYLCTDIKAKIKDNMIIVHGKHKERQDFASVTRQFTRKYRLPEDVSVDDVVAYYDGDNLFVSAKKRTPSIMYPEHLNTPNDQATDKKLSSRETSSSDVERILTIEDRTISTAERADTIPGNIITEIIY